MELKQFICCNKRYTWIPGKDTILAPDEDPPQKARLVHVCEKRAIWNDKTRMWFKQLEAKRVLVTETLSSK
jgi:hypothetical protein